MADNWNSKRSLVSHYDQYQAKYADTIRESDKVLLKLISERPNARSLLDVGCSTGNFLAHVRASFPHLKLTGGDISESSLAHARANPKIAGVDLQVMDITAIKGRYDIIVVNAVTSIVPEEFFPSAMRSVADALNPGGSFISFEWMHEFEQNLEIRERSNVCPEGLSLFFRPYSVVKGALADAGLTDITITPYDIPIDLPFPGFENVTTYTRNDAEGRRMCFRGILFQPWAFVTAKKPS